MENQEQTRRWGKFTSRANKYIINFKQKPETEKRLWILVVILAIFAFILLICIIAHGRKRRIEICTTPQCIATAHNILQMIDFNKNPCDDFFEYACGRYSENFKEESVFERQSFLMDLEINEFMKKPLPKNAIQAIKNAQQLLFSCLDLEYRNQVGMEPILDILDMIGLPRTLPSEKTIEKFNLGEILSKIRRELNIEMMLTSNKDYIEPDEMDNLNETTLGFVIEPNDFQKSIKESYPKWFKTLVKNKKENEDMFGELNMGYVEEREAFVFGLIKELLNSYKNYSDYTNDDIQMTVSNILTTKPKLPKENQEIVFKRFYQVMNFSEFNDFLNEGLETTDPKYIDLNSYMKKVYGLWDDEDGEVYIRNMDYFKKLKQFIRNTENDSIQRMIWWDIIETFSIYTSQKAQLIRENFIRKIVIEYKQISIEEQCIKTLKTFYIDAITHQISKDPQLKQKIKEAKKLYENLRKAFKKMVYSANWIDRDTKKKAIEKVNKMKSYIGLPSFIYDEQQLDKKYSFVNISKNNHFLLQMIEYRSKENDIQFEIDSTTDDVTKTADEIIDEERWKHLESFDINAVYLEIGNYVVVPIGIMRPPFFDISIRAFDYGAFGTILGHEITHGFDDTGKDYDSNGNKVNWWSSEMEKRFNERASCFINQYNNKKINGTVKLTENIADNGGIRNSFWAYQGQRQPSESEPRLPGLEYFTPEQLFFLGFANVWCSRPLTEKDLLDEDEHSPKPIRIQATLENFEEFSKAWKCPVGSPMNPVNKCIIW